MDTTADTDDGVQDEIAVLDQLESDLAAVEQAIERLDHITAEDVEGEIAAARIDAAVSAERFGTTSPDHPDGVEPADEVDQPVSAEVTDDVSPTPFG
jgi:hypothetical protein